MEILNIKNKDASLFIMGDVCGGEEIKITCDDTCTVKKKNGSLYRNKKYNIFLFNEKSDIEIIIDENKASPLYTVNNSGFAFYEFDFCDAGEKQIHIFKSGKSFASITFDVCRESFLYKKHFEKMMNKIGKAAENEAYLLLKDACVRYNIKFKDNIFLTLKTLYDRLLNELKRCNMAEKRSKRNFLIFRRKWSVERKKKLKKSFVALFKLTEKFMPFCNELCDLKQEIEDKILKSVLSSIEIKEFYI